MARFSAGKAPFIRIADEKNQGTQVIMRDFIIGLLPIILFAWYKNGIKVYLEGNVSFLEMLYPLVFILLGGLISFLMEGLFFIITDPKLREFKPLMDKISTSFALIPGLLLAMVLPLYTPIWVLIFGAFMGTIVGKMLFGGFGHNIFNPALLGYIAVGFTLIDVINANGGVMNQSEVLIDAYAGATPLSLLANIKTISYDQLVTPYGTLWNFFIGTIPGALAETGALAIIIAYVWLSYRKVLKWFTPLIYVGTVFVVSWVLGAVIGDAGVWFPLYSILSGGLMFGAVLMATEPVSSPKNPLGKVFMALLLGVLTVLFRYVGNYPEGVGTSLILLNIFAMPLDRFSATIRAEGYNKKSSIIKIALFVLFVLAIAAYAIIKANGMYTAGGII